MYSQDELRCAIPDCFNPSSVINNCLLQGMEGPGIDGPAWKRQRMDDGPGGPSRQDSVFYKTRMCHKCAFLPFWQGPLGPLCIIMAWQEGSREQACGMAQGQLVDMVLWQKLHIHASLHLKNVAGRIERPASMGAAFWQSQMTKDRYLLCTCRVGLLQILEGKAIYRTPSLCCRWQEGRCTFGERCNYAHGEADLRPLPAEGYEILERLETRRMRQDVSPMSTSRISVTLRTC